nr:glycosyl hydrolase [uncultured Cellulosilyticum sp.]
MRKVEFTLNNPNALPICKTVMKYFESIYGKGIISGQHTNAAKGTQVEEIYEITGKYPAIRSFDLLSYTAGSNTEKLPNKEVRTEDMEIDCHEEVAGNRGSVEEAIRWWEEKGGLITLCWHWFAPCGGYDKTFYVFNTDFDIEKALCEGTAEHKAMMKDISDIAQVLMRFKERNIPILWRPLHEADGNWFWWSRKGAEAYKKLYHLLYQELTEHYNLNNLIWVWNAPKIAYYVGDTYCDIGSCDVYGPAYDYSSDKREYEAVVCAMTGSKPVALSESFIMPHPESLIKDEVPWLYFTIWNWEEEEVILSNMTKEHMKEVYNHPYVITLEDLPNFK